ncbi:MAG TPA: DNA-processing protein DprA [Candidatus Moranbacteria bacterium]|nr:DNA-processing protein DprA [Candidatus Moranbacteria bacterium]
MLELADNLYVAALAGTEGIGAKKMAALLAYFGSGQKIWQATLPDLAESGIGQKAALSIDSHRKNCDLTKLQTTLAAAQIQVLTLLDPPYPRLLRQLDDAPAVLYARGDCSCLDLPTVAVVGSRAHTAYGRQAAFSLSRDLARSGVCIASGLALGIDAVAHEGALEGGGKTIAVLGSGPDPSSVAPRANAALAERIISCGGLVLSEYAPRTEPSVGTFPARNRIIAGISAATLVVEASASSGSLITATHALECGRDVFAVPGSIFSPRSEGTNALIQKGAKLIASAADVLEELRLSQTAPLEKKEVEFDLGADEKRILHVLTDEQLHIDRIIKLSTLETSRAAAAVSLLELKGLIRDMGGRNYLRI